MNLISTNVIGWQKRVRANGLKLIPPVFACAYESHLIDKRRAFEAAEEQKRLIRPIEPISGQSEALGSRLVNTARGANLKTGNVSATTPAIPDEFLPPNKILFVRDFPASYDVEALTVVFGRFEGFKEVRLVPGRQGIAFVEYDTEQGAITAKENTAGMAFDQNHVIKVTYQRH